MEFVSLDKKIDEADPDKLPNVQLFGTDNFRSWMLYFEPGDGTPMHYHQSPQTFPRIDGRCSVKSIDGHEKILEKNDVVFLPAKEILSAHQRPRDDAGAVRQSLGALWREAGPGGQPLAE